MTCAMLEQSGPTIFYRRTPNRLYFIQEFNFFYQRMPNRLYFIRSLNYTLIVYETYNSLFNGLQMQTNHFKFSL